MSQVFTLLGFAAHLDAMARDVDRELGPAIVRKACEMVAKRARKSLGSYAYGHDWPQLAQSTQERRAKAGYPPNKPLLVTGELRDSIEWNSSGNEGHVGSNSDIAVYMEFGTRTIPPRPFFGPAVAYCGPRIANMAGRTAVAYLSGGGPHAREFREMMHALHLLHRAGHAIAELARELTEDDDDDR